ncbi:MAG TPA: hypothetical protein VFW39_05205 [Sphingomicrobium sp.]|nr:hypothetical protein [Sphingomicrobium sp.]
MENDSVRTMGDSTVVDLWIQGKFRAITISRHAIERYLGLASDGTSGLTDDERSEFVRTHLGQVQSAALERLRSDPGADAIAIDSARLGRLDEDIGERRTSDRRKGDRRKLNLGAPGGIERRRR